MLFYYIHPNKHHQKIMFQAYYNNIKEYVDIKFVKVKGHSGDKYNDMADKLAKEALGIN